MNSSEFSQGIWSWYSPQCKGSVVPEQACTWSCRACVVPRQRVSSAAF